MVPKIQCCEKTRKSRNLSENWLTWKSPENQDISRTINELSTWQKINGKRKWSIFGEYFIDFFKFVVARISEQFSVLTFSDLFWNISNNRAITKLKISRKYFPNIDHFLVPTIFCKGDNLLIVREISWFSGVLIVRSFWYHSVLFWKDVVQDVCKPRVSYEVWKKCNQSTSFLR